MLRRQSLLAREVTFRSAWRPDRTHFFHGNSNSDHILNNLCSGGRALSGGASGPVGFVGLGNMGEFCYICIVRKCGTAVSYLITIDDLRAGSFWLLACGLLVWLWCSAPCWLCSLCAVCCAPLPMLCCVVLCTTAVVCDSRNECGLALTFALK